MNYFDTEVIEKLTKFSLDYELAGEKEKNLIINNINSLPFYGSKIKWDSLSELKSFAISTELNQGLIFLKNKLHCKNINYAYFCGDSNTEEIYKIKIDNLETFTNIFIETSQHIYITSMDMDFIVCLSMEGYFDYGEL
ncbi:hypothetical protein EGJ52_07100 [Pseudomonas luteola]|uniref:hypothetical protein n=1 Tax=Pseudomonas luteola TaxID=47886 RepID=UPI000F770F71|nr:hypothetical protein [Pseudomonas luteola]RRW45520.1 hypothetical protein EGJ52_07100 [Pseudomonas luteola]